MITGPLRHLCSAPGFIQFVKFAVVGFIGYGVGMINSFLLNKFWTFGVRETSLVHVRRFFILNVIGLTISTLAILVLVDMLGAPYMPVWFATIVVVTLFNFFGNKHWTFL